MLLNRPPQLLMLQVKVARCCSTARRTPGELPLESRIFRSQARRSYGHRPGAAPGRGPAPQVKIRTREALI